MAVEYDVIDGSTLETIRKRKKFIGSVRRTKEFIQRKHKLPALLLRAVTRAVVARTRLVGHKSLEFFKENIGQQQMTIAANHTSDADHSSLDLALDENGFSDLADHLHFASGLKMWDRPQTSWGMRGMNTFPIAAPGYFDEALEMEKLSLRPEQRVLLEEYQSGMSWLNLASLRAILPHWRTGHAVVVVYPEATRSRNGLTQRGRWETAVFFKRGWTLPMMIEGLDEVFPPNALPRWEKILRREVEVKVSAGAPIDTSKLWLPSTLKWLEERQATPVDFVMSRIHALNPERTDPQVRPLYDSLLQDIPSYFTP